MAAETFYEGQVLPPKDPNSGLPTLVRRGKDWVPMGPGPQASSLNPNAPGAPYLPKARTAPNPSSEAGFTKFQAQTMKGADTARKGMAEDREMEGYLARQQTGGKYAVPVLGDVLGMFDPEIRGIERLSSAAARSKRTPGEGTISDFDAKMFLQQVPGKAQPTATNRAIIRADRIAQDQVLQQAAMADWWHKQHGTIDGFQEAWDIYRNANPIFDPKSEALGQPILNGKRQNWRQYFGDVRGPADEKPSVPMADIQREFQRNEKAKLGQSTKELDMGAVSPKALATAKLYSKSKAKSGTEGNPWVPVNEEEMKAIPSGSWFINAADGRRLVKR